MYDNLMLVSDPTFQRLHNFIAFVSQPVFYMFGDRLSFVSIILDMLLFMLYWAILGMCVACGSVWLYSFISRKCRTTVNSSGKAGPVDV